MLIKLGEAITVTKDDLKPNILDDDDPEITRMFQDGVIDLKARASAEAAAESIKTGKAIAPKAKDFLYFTAVMMHAAEAALLDETGALKKTADGKDVEAHWDTDNDTWIWRCNDPNIKPFKNSNADIFPAQELKKAYKKWVAKPLCLDHQSQSVDMMRGLVIDTYWDDKRQRVVALCALDKVGYPELAHKVSTGMAASVSMGTAVGRAICTELGCHRVAKTEADFCEHMKSKTCYGEINVDLSPIELSIVVNGADPGAKIRRVLAAADSIAQYVDAKEQMVREKRAMTLEEVRQLKEDLKNIEAKIDSLGEDEEVNPPYGQQGRGSLEMTETEVSDVAGNNPQGFPDRYASELLSDVTRVLNEKVAQLDNFINKMASVEEGHLNNIEDNTMTNKKNAYFQGGGGVNEPAPKQVKYPKEDSDSIRNNEDKQMVGQPPFPDVGPVDGMHPSPASVPESEEARKKKLLRMAAENEQRKMRREAALERAKNAIDAKGYFQGGGGVNEPTPGKPKYEKEDSDGIRNNEDKQMVGAPPFPNVGKPDGLYGNDLAEKKKLLRAKLNARFVKSAEKGQDRWEIYHGDNLILTASVNDLVGPDKVAAFYDSIATKVYGKKILDTIRSQGFNTALSIFKGAQAVAGPGAAPDAPPDAGGAAPVPEMPPAMPGEGAEPPVDTGESGSPAEALATNLDEVDGLIADMKRQVQSLKEEQAGGMEGAVEPGPEAMATASVSLPAMRKTLNQALVKGAQQAISDLSDHKEELQLLQHVYNTDGAVNTENSEVVSDLATEAVNDVKGTIANVYKLMSAFVKYARGTEALIKRAGEESEMTKSEKDDEKAEKAEKAEKKEKEDEKKEKEEKEEKEKKEEKDDKNDADIADINLAGLEPDDPEALASYLEELSSEEDEPLEDEISVSEDEDIGDAVNIKFEGGEPAEATADTSQELEGLLGNASSENLAALRTKIAQKGVAFSDMLQKAHPSGGFTTDLDTKPTGDLAKVETLPEAHTKMMDVANAPPRVRKAAEDIQRLVQAGKIDPVADFPALISQGLDPQAVSYWKQMWGEAGDSESSQYVNDLVKEYHNKKAEEENTKYRVKVARAFELAHEMAQRGIIGGNREAISEQVSALMTFTDGNFEHLKATVGRYPLKKTASIPNVGYPSEVMMGSPDVALPAVETRTESLMNDLDAAFRNRKY